MAINLSQLLKDADEIIEKRASKKSEETPRHDDISKLAAELRGSAADTAGAEWSAQEKIAHAVMLVATYANLPELVKMAQFESKALEAGYSKEDVGQFIEKRAAQKTGVTLQSLIPWIGD